MDLTGIPWATLTPATLLGIVVLMIFTGRLIVLPVYRSLEADRDHWRDAAREAQTVIHTQAGTIAQQARAADAYERAFGAIESASTRGGDTE